jgi:preprotein translocase subunit SecA
VMIVDPSTGRVQANRRWNDNIHQAVEVGLRRSCLP